MEYKIFEQKTKEKPKYEGKLRYLNEKGHNVNRPNFLHFRSLRPSFKYKFSGIPQKVTISKYVHKRDDAKIESDASEYLNRVVLADDGKYDIDNEYVFNPEYNTIKLHYTDRPKGVDKDKFTTKQMKMLNQNIVEFLNDNQLPDRLLVNETTKKIYDIDSLNLTFNRHDKFESIPMYKEQETNYDRKWEPIYINKKTSLATTTSKTIVLEDKVVENSVVIKPKDNVPTVENPLADLVVSAINMAPKPTTKTIMLAENNLLRLNLSGTTF